MLRTLKKGSAEMVSIILLVVVVGGLALATSGSFTKQSKQSFDQGMSQTTTQLGTNYNEAATMRTATNPELAAGTTE